MLTIIVDREHLLLYKKNVVKGWVEPQVDFDKYYENPKSWPASDMLAEYCRGNLSVMQVLKQLPCKVEYLEFGNNLYYANCDSSVGARG